MNKILTVTELSGTKNTNLSEIIYNWQDYEEDTLVSSVLEYKKRNLVQSELFLSKISEIEISKSQSISQLEKKYLEKNGVETYLELKKKMEDNPTEEEKRRKQLHQAYREVAFHQESAAKGNSSKDIIFGSLWFLGGGIVTLISLSSGKGGVIAYGAIIFGAIQFGRGVYNSMN